MSPIAPDTGSRTVDAILAAAHRIRTVADAALRANGLSLSGFKLLRALEPGSLAMRELSDALGITPRTVTDLVDNLERRGLVVRGPHPSDRRVSLIALTPAGRTELGRARCVADVARDAAIGELSDAEQVVLVDLLARVHAGAPAEVGSAPEPSAAGPRG